MSGFKVGDAVKWDVCGGVIRGTVEEINDHGDIGVRLENNNFKWLPPHDLRKNIEYQPKTGTKCSCKRGVQRDNCPACEGTGFCIDFAAIRARAKS